MPSCPYCGFETEYIEEYGQFYCYNCLKYSKDVASQEPMPPPQPYQQFRRYPPKPDRTKRIYIAIVVFFIVLFVFAVITYFIIYVVYSPERVVVNMDMQELRNDTAYDSEMRQQFKSLEEGNTLVVKDEIAYITSDYTDLEGYMATYVWLESAHEGEDIDDWHDPWRGIYYEFDFVFKGDLTTDFQTGDEVKITLHIINTDQYGEIFEEEWDGQTLVYLPKSCIKLIHRNVDDGITDFPTLEISIADFLDNGDRMIIKHVAGKTIDWGDYMVMIIDNSSDTAAQMYNLDPFGEFSLGEFSLFDSTVSGFSDIDYQQGKSYSVEIYHLKENRRAYNSDNIICE